MAARDETRLASAGKIGLVRTVQYGHNSHVEKVTISQLKNRLSAYLKKVRAGQTILVLDRDEPVARIEAVGASADSDDRVARLERAGLLRRARQPVPTKTLRSGAPPSRLSVVEALLEERRESR